MFVIKMRTTLKFNSFWLRKATILIFVLTLAFLNMSIQEAIDESSQPKTMKVVLTGYSSTFDQTDDTPFVTASNTRVRDGIVAANFLAFGTKVKIPAVFGDKVFTVEDRMAKKHNDKMDVWFSERHLARNFGIKEADVIILE